MPIEVSCPSCAGHFRVPDSAAGKKIRCPKCKGAMDVPAAEESAPVPAEDFVPPPVTKPQPAATMPPLPPLPAKSPALAPPEPPAEEWYLQTADGEEYGPVSRAELDDWFAEGRITADYQLRRGTEEWQWAADVYPQLDAAARVSGSRSQGSGTRPAKRPKKQAAARVLADADQQVGQAFQPAMADKNVCPTYSQRSRLVAGFLGIFLGPLGIHRFYLGYWGVGLAMLFTAGGLYLWALIDAIFVMTGRIPDADGRPLSA